MVNPEDSSGALAKGLGKAGRSGSTFARPASSATRAPEAPQGTRSEEFALRPLQRGDPRPTGELGWRLSPERRLKCGWEN